MIEILHQHIEGFESLNHKETARYFADLLAQNPQYLPDFILDVNVLSSRMYESSDTAPLDAQVQLFTRQVFDHIRDYNWKSINTSPLPHELSIQLLDTLTQTEHDSDTTATSSHLHDITQEVMFGYMSRRFGPGGHWKEAFDNLYAVTGAVFSEQINVSRMATWFSVVTGGFQHIPLRGSTLEKSLFLALSDPSAESEDRLARAIDFQNTKSLIARLLDKKQWFYESSNFPAYIRTLLQLASGKQRPTIQTQLFMQVAHSIKAHEDRFKEIRNRLDLDGKRSELIPDEWISNAANYSLIARKLLVLTEQKALYRDLAFDYAATVHKSFAIIGINLPGIAGFIILPRHEAPAIDDDGNAAFELSQTILRDLHVTDVFSDELAAISSGKREFATGEINQYGFFLTRGELMSASKTASTLKMLLPESVTEHGIALLNDTLQIKRFIAKSFNRSLTKAGVRFDLIDNDRLPHVFSDAIMYLESSGTFIVRINPAIPAKLNTTEMPEPIDFRIRLEPGNVSVICLNETITRMDLPIQWFLEKSALQLLQSQCCLTHSQLLELEEHLFHIEIGEQKRKKGRYPGQIVHVGAIRMDGTPGQHTRRASDNFAHDVYGIEIDPNLTDEDADKFVMEHGGVPLSMINARHAQENRKCKKTVTWNVGHESEELDLIPTNVETPVYLFS